MPKGRLAYSVLCLQGWLHGRSEELTWKRVAGGFAPVLSLLLLVFCALGERGFLLFFPSSVVLYAFREKEYAFWSVVHSKYTHLTKIC